MALTNMQQDQVDAFKKLVGDTEGFDDQDLYDILIALGNENSAAAHVWRIKASNAADLIDVREGSSTRPLSQLRANALSMAEHYSGLAASERSSAGTRTKTRAIVRP